MCVRVRVCISALLAWLQATMAWESQDDGFIAKILLQEGAKDIPVGTPAMIFVEEEVCRRSAWPTHPPSVSSGALSFCPGGCRGPACVSHDDPSVQTTPDLSTISTKKPCSHVSRPCTLQHHRTHVLSGQDLYIAHMVSSCITEALSTNHLKVDKGLSSAV